MIHVNIVIVILRCCCLIPTPSLPHRPPPTPSVEAWCGHVIPAPINNPTAGVLLLLCFLRLPPDGASVEPRWSLGGASVEPRWSASTGRFELAPCRMKHFFAPSLSTGPRGMQRLGNMNRNLLIFQKYFRWDWNESGRWKVSTGGFSFPSPLPGAHSFQPD